jgi:23S rRNA G2069 N7-methylase RlmK/C1962 C5-methylase RlmI
MEAVLDVQRDHRQLIESCLQLLTPKGELYFSTNKRRFKLDQDLASHPGCKEITRETLPDDFKRHPAHQCWTFRQA